MTFKEVLHRAADPGVQFSELSSQNVFPFLSASNQSISVLNSANETLGQCGHFPLSESKIRRVVSDILSLEVENYLLKDPSARFYIVNHKAYLHLCGGPL